MYNRQVSEKQKIASGFARVYGAQPALPHATSVSVECDITKGLHAFAVVGLPDKSVEEAKDRIASAIKNSGLESPKRSNKKIVLSLAPAALKKEGAVFDVSLALAFLRASEQLIFDPKGKLFAGELALDGEIRPIAGALSIASLAKEKGYTDLYLPEDNAEEASLVSGVRIHAIAHLKEVMQRLRSRKDPVYVRREPKGTQQEDAALDEIRGQETAKRALVIAAAGGHNIALFGPPGTGKTLLARAAVSILPNLTEDEMIEVTTIHSLAGALHGGGVFRPPFRSPHHTSSYSSLIGGGSGSVVRPGEVTLSHRGVLFADEFPEFHRDVIQALREPLEDGVVSISRAKSSATFPANFMLIAALNPCPCGYWGSQRCECMPHIVEKYRRKIEGPIADRIDVWVQVGEMPPETLMRGAKKSDGETKTARDLVSKAREQQRKRFAKSKIRLNADMRPKDIDAFAELTDEAEKQLVAAAHRLKLSPRGYHRTIKLARTIADLAASDSIEPAHMLEALQYRVRDL